MWVSNRFRYLTEVIEARRHAGDTVEAIVEHIVDDLDSVFRPETAPRFYRKEWK